MPPFSGPLSEDELLAWLELLRWPAGPICPHCRRKAAQAPGRPGFYRCRGAGCRKQFTITLGTVLERTHHELVVWWNAVNHLVAAEQGLTVRRLQSLLALPYRSTWSIMERLRKIAPNRRGPLTLSPLTTEEAFIRLLARPSVLPGERFERLEQRVGRIEESSHLAERKHKLKQ